MFVKTAIPLLLLLGVLGALWRLSVHDDAATRELEELERRFDRRTELVASWKSAAAKLHEDQVAALAQLSSLESQPQEVPRCDDLKPSYELGLGVLQVASVREDRGDDVERFARFQVKRLNAVLARRGLSQWMPHLSQYPGLGKVAIRRVVFNNIAPDSGAAMCNWLKCEQWSGGCAFIDDKGQEQVHVAAPQDTAPFFEPSVDLYQNWHLSML
jgi:hypothetical protein